MSIESLNENDVLLGRGTGPSSFVGNDRFRQLIDTRRNEYVTCPRNSTKALIAKQVVDKIHSLGGRFVRQVKKGRKEGDLVVGGLWKEVDDSVAVEKAQQALREKLHGKPSNKEEDEATKETIISVRQTASRDVTDSRGGGGMESAALSHLFERNGLGAGLPSHHHTSLAGSSYLLPSVQPSPIDARLLLFHSNGLASLPTLQLRVLAAQELLLGQEGGLNRQQNPLAQYASLDSTIATQFEAQSSLQQDIGRNLSNVRKRRIEELIASRSQPATSEYLGDSRATPSPETEEQLSPVQEPPPTELENDTPLHNRKAQDVIDEDTAAYVLASLALTNRRMITMEERERELASLTNEQRASALADLFGEMNVDNRDPQTKRAKNDLDRESIDFLIGQMRVETDRINDKDKQELLEAKAKCRPEEFADSRLEMFLRCEGMNVMLAAKRFALYWKKRKETFGPDKFTMRITLSEALNDEDIVALESGAFNLLPNKDSSGRQLFFVSPHENTGEGYTSDSLLRAIWYISEVAASRNTHARCGIVDVIWLKPMTIWDYDAKAYDRSMMYFQHVWPVKTVAAHACCPTGVVARLIIPVCNAVSDAWTRSRTKIHDVPVSNIVHTLEEYGIKGEMLPTEMGGKVKLNPSEWIAERRAIEMSMEELP